MAILEARAGVARSGVTYAGLTFPNVRVLISGVNRITEVSGVDFTIQQLLDGSASTCQLELCGYTPTAGERVLITRATPGDYLFAGTILQLQGEPHGPLPEAVRWQCTAVGDTWLLDRFARVTRRYENRGLGTILADILATFTDGGFRIGYIPSNLGNCTIAFVDEFVTAAIDRLAKSVEGYWEISPSRVVSIYETYPDAALFAIGNTTEIDDVVHTADLTQVRTRVLFQGESTTTSAPVAAGATTIPVRETGVFQASGLAIAGSSILTYTGRTTASGEGSLTGVSGLAQDLSEGHDIAVRVQFDDGPAQTALAALLGGGLSGVATQVLTKDDATVIEATQRAAADVALFKAPMTEFGYRSVSEAHRKVRVGRLQTVNLTAPFTVSDTFRVQSVTLAAIGGAAADDVVHLERQVALSRFRRTLTQILGRG